MAVSGTKKNYFKIRNEQFLYTMWDCRSNIQSTFCQNWYPWCDPFLRKKRKMCFEFFKVGLELLRSCLRIIFGLQIPIFMRTLCLKGWYMTPKIKVLGPMLALWEDQFDYVSGEKPIILGFLQKRILECNRSCLPLGGFFWP